MELVGVIDCLAVVKLDGKRSDCGLIGGFWSLEKVSSRDCAQSIGDSMMAGLEDGPHLGPCLSHSAHKWGGACCSLLLDQ